MERGKVAGTKRRTEWKRVWARMDRWTEVVDASGQTHLPLKQATRVETVFLQQQPARGVWIWAKESDTVGGWIVSRGRVPCDDNRRFMSFPETSVATLTTSIFLPPSLPLSFSPFSVRTCTRENDRRSHAGKVFTNSRHGPHRDRWFESADRLARFSTRKRNWRNIFLYFVFLSFLAITEKCIVE